MKKRVEILLLSWTLILASMAIVTEIAQARTHIKAKITKKHVEKQLVARNRAGVRRHKKDNTHWESRHAVARQRATAYHQTLIARTRVVDGSLLNVVQNHIHEDDMRGEDMEMRTAAVEALSDHAGTVVMMNPNDGHVYSIVNQKWAIGKPVKPCSTIKLITSIAALSEGIADPDYPMDISGGGVLTMINALAYSNNEYFQALGEQLGFEQVITYAREWGLGEQTGINLLNESPGFVPKYKPQQAVPHMCSHGDDIGVTAIQLAVLTSAISNGGYIYQPQVLRTEKEQRNFKPILVRKVELAEADRQKIIEGMLGSVSYGTARRSGVATLNVAGKTGSCNGEESKLGLFASFTSPSNPNLVIVVISTGSSEKGSASSIIAGEIYAKLEQRLNNLDKVQRPRRINSFN